MLEKKNNVLYLNTILAVTEFLPQFVGLLQNSVK